MRLLHFPRVARVVALALLAHGVVPPEPVHAAKLKAVQSGSVASIGNGVLRVGITPVDPAKTFLIFGTRHDYNEPTGSMVRGRIVSTDSLEFVRVGDAADTTAMPIEWSVVEYASGIRVQRGEVNQTATTVNVTLPGPVGALDRAFVTWSKTPGAANVAFSNAQPILGQLTTTSNLQLRSSASQAEHVISWQVVEFLDPADVKVQSGVLTTMRNTALTVSATLGSAVDPAKTFVLAGYTMAGGGADIGSRLLRAVLTNPTTVTIDRSTVGALTGDDILEIAWQAVELRDGSHVQGGSTNFAAGVSQVPVAVTSVDPGRSVAFASVQPVGGQNMGRSPHIADDIIGVSSFTMDVTSPTQVTMTRNNTAASADVGWFVVEFGDVADLAVTKGASNPTPNAGDPVTYTITLTNNGPDVATDVQVTDLLPAGLTLQSYAATQGTYADSTGIWAVGSVANAGSATLTLNTTVNAGTGGTTIINAASVSATNQVDDNTANDSATASVTVQAADVAVAKSVDDGTPDENDAIAYTVVVSNGGPDAATSVEVTDLLPAGVTLQSHSATQGTYVSGTGVWTVGSVANAASATLTLNAIVDGGTAGTTIVNTAFVTTSTQEDPIGSNNSAAAGVSVQSHAPDELQVTSGVGQDQRPSWSPDEATLAFDSDRAGNPDLWLVPSTGGTVTQLTTNPRLDRHPDWSPDGTQLVFSGRIGAGDPSPDLWLMASSGGSPTILQSDPFADEEFPAWSPDGGRVAFSKGGDIWIVAAAGGTPLQVTTDPANDAHPSWSPDGTQIVFASDRSGNNDLWVVSSTGGVATQIVSDPASDSAPDWSPDGMRIAFQSNRAGDTEVWLVPAAGGSALRVTSTSGFDVQPAWSPSGSRIAFARDGDLWIYSFPIDLAVTHGVSDASPDPGDAITYTVVVRNGGPKPALGVLVTDILPAGVTFQSSSATQGSYDADTGLWQLGDVPFGVSETLLLTCTVNLGTGGETIVCNAAARAAGQADRDPSDDQAPATITVRTVLAISSAASGFFMVGAAPAAIGAVTITDDDASPSITSTADLRIRIPAGLDMTWDTADATATIGGPAAAKVSPAVTYEDAGKTLVVDVVTTFAAGDRITIADLSFMNFAAPSSGQLGLEAHNDGQVSALDDKTMTLQDPTGVDTPFMTPTAFALAPPRPNPFRGATWLEFDIAVAGVTRLRLVDVAGRVVRTLVDGEVAIGRYRSLWDGLNDGGQRASAGVYFARLESGSFRETRKLLLLR